MQANGAALNFTHGVFSRKNRLALLGWIWICSCELEGFSTGVLDTSCQVTKSGLDCGIKLVEGTTHESARFPFVGARVMVGTGAVRRVQIAPLMDPAATNRFPSAERATGPTKAFPAIVLVVHVPLV